MPRQKVSSVLGYLQPRPYGQYASTVSEATEGPGSEYIPPEGKGRREFN